MELERLGFRPRYFDKWRLSYSECSWHSCSELFMFGSLWTLLILSVLFHLLHPNGVIPCLFFAIMFYVPLVYRGFQKRSFLAGPFRGISKQEGKEMIEDIRRRLPFIRWILLCNYMGFGKWHRSPDAKDYYYPTDEDWEVGSPSGLPTVDLFKGQYTRLVVLLTVDEGRITILSEPERFRARDDFQKTHSGHQTSVHEKYEFVYYDLITDGSSSIWWIHPCYVASSILGLYPLFRWYLSSKITDVTYEVRKKRLSTQFQARFTGDESRTEEPSTNHNRSSRSRSSFESPPPVYEEAVLIPDITGSSDEAGEHQDPPRAETPPPSYDQYVNR